VTNDLHVTSRSPGAPTSHVRRAAHRSRFRGQPWTWAWIIAGLLVVIDTIVRLGLLDLMTTVRSGNSAVHLPAIYATVDHPFHVARAETLRRALADGHLLRWMPHHQGGYPVEFYPLGVAWLDIGLWGLLGGMLPMAAVHKLVVGLIFLLPGAGFLLAARRDRWPLGVGVTALVAHLVVPGGWWHGGYTELVQWGLVTNVAANVALLFVLLFLTSYLQDGGRTALGASLAAAFAIYSNPRSLIALAVIGLGVLLASVSGGPGRGDIWRSGRRLLAVGLVTIALTGPELLSLLRFADLYYFVHYQSYSGAGDFFQNARDAVSFPVFLLGAGGVVAGWWLPARIVTRAAAITLPLYVAVTLALTLGPSGIDQLETTRLMPFQRLLTIYLAAVGLWSGVTWVIRWLPGRRTAGLGGGICLLLVTLFAVRSIAPSNAEPPALTYPPAPSRGLFAVETAAVPEQVAFERAVRAADAAAPPGTAIQVIGSALSWHQRLWAPIFSTRQFFYDDWLWDWNRWHVGPRDFDPLVRHSYPRPDLALSRDYLDRQAIGAIVVTGTSRPAAAASTELSSVRAGLFDVYTVRDPRTLVTEGGRNATDIGATDNRIAATIDGPGGDVLLRRNWHPRWRVTVNGVRVATARGEGGYIAIKVPAGKVRVEMTYAVDRIDWLGRLAALAGVVTVISLLLRPGFEPAHRRTARSR
jgi:hypothetical protein